MTRPYTLALDIGATKIAYGVVFDDSPLTAHHTGRLPTQPGALPGAKPGAQQGGGTPQEQVRRALHAGALDYAPARVGMGAPGIIEGTKVAYAGETLPGWRGTDLRELCPPGIPLAVANDVRVWAYGEHNLGIQRAGRLLYLALGTGVGGALIENHALAPSGEVSELPCADYQGACRRLEDVASGTGLARAYNQAAGTNLDLREIVTRGDALLQRILEGNLAGLGSLLGALATAFALDAVVIGGGVAQIGAAVMDPIRSSCRPLNRRIPVLTTTLGADAPLLAAARFARDECAECPAGGG